MGLLTGICGIRAKGVPDWPHYVEVDTSIKTFNRRDSCIGNLTRFCIIYHYHLDVPGGLHKT